MSSLRSALVSKLPRPVANRLRAIKRSLMPNYVDETEIVASIASAHPVAGSVLVDVGAHQGAVTALFVQKGWSAVAYEPDPANREEFERRVGSHPAVQLSQAAVSDKPAQTASFFTSAVSTGISTLAAFHESHEPTTKVEVVTLAEDLRVRGVQRVDFLKIDIEGFDFLALKGFDWSYSPRYVLYEFEDRKTVPLGYSLADSSGFMAGHGYHLVYSVWDPIIEYGGRHRWRGLYSSPPVDVADCWGNVICFREEVEAQMCLQTFARRPSSWLGSVLALRQR